MTSPASHDTGFGDGLVVPNWFRNPYGPHLLPTSIVDSVIAGTFQKTPADQPIDLGRGVILAPAEIDPQSYLTACDLWLPEDQGMSPLH